MEFRIRIEQKKIMPLRQRKGLIIGPGETGIHGIGNHANVGELSAQHFERSIRRGIVHDPDFGRQTAVVRLPSY